MSGIVKEKNSMLVPGTPCDNLKGYCDVFAVCRRVNMAGPLLRLKQQFFTVEGTGNYDIILFCWE